MTKLLCQSMKIIVRLFTVYELLFKQSLCQELANNIQKEIVKLWLEQKRPNKIKYR